MTAQSSAKRKRAIMCSTLHVWFITWCAYLTMEKQMVKKVDSIGVQVLMEKMLPAVQCDSTKQRKKLRRTGQTLRCRSLLGDGFCVCLICIGILQELHPLGKVGKHRTCREKVAAGAFSRGVCAATFFNVFFKVT